MDSQAHPLPHGLSWSSPLCSVRFPRDIPFFDPAGMLVDFDRGAVQHQRCFVHQILLNQGCEDIFPYSSFCPGTEPAVHTLPWPEPLRQIPPWYSGVQPIQDCVEHFTVAFSWPASLRLFFRWKLVLDPIPLFFTDFMSFHVLYFTISALYTQYLSFQTDSSVLGMSATQMFQSYSKLSHRDQHAICKTFTEYLKLDARDQGNIDNEVMKLSKSDRYSTQEKIQTRIGNRLIIDFSGE